MHCLVMDSRYRQVNHSHPSSPHPASRDHRDYNLNFTAPRSGTMLRKAANLVHVARNSGASETLAVSAHTCVVTFKLGMLKWIMCCAVTSSFWAMCFTYSFHMCTETSLCSQLSSDAMPHDSILQSYDSPSVDIKARKRVCFICQLR